MRRGTGWRLRERALTPFNRAVWHGGRHAVRGGAGQGALRVLHARGS